MEFIALDNQPFSVVGNVGFHDSNSITGSSFTTYYAMPFESSRVKKDKRQITLFDVLNKLQFDMSNNTVLL